MGRSQRNARMGSGKGAAKNAPKGASRSATPVKRTAGRNEPDATAFKSIVSPDKKARVLKTDA